ncbi:MAG TPA: multidrug efflux RND transporter permease subunit [Tepidisphaeraceae bacterium]|nr:multidrug efflux RND transporter permease subunit [Tepidisphaeraceae bacterium]
MSLSTPFIQRPVGTTLLTIALALSGILAYQFLPVAPLPQVDFPTISVGASLPGASPETMATSVATPLERQFGRIASVTEMTSSSGLGTTSITLQFDLNRNIDAAARDVQAAINAARSNLPADLPSQPTYRKVNPADAPILIIAMTSEVYSRGQMYDSADSILAQKLSQVDGVGQCFVGGGASPAVRVEVNPTALNNLGLDLNSVATVLSSANANLAKGQVGDDHVSQTLSTTDQLFKAAQYKQLLVEYVNGAPVRLSDVADVEDSVANVRTQGLADGKPSVVIIIFRQPNANIIETVDRIEAMMPELQAEVPAGMHLKVVMDRTTTIRASVHDTQITLMLSVMLVVLVVYLFLRDWRTTFIPSIAVPVSLVGTFGVMYLANYSVDNLSLMALTIATGFVVDDAIVVIENITRHIEAGMRPMQASLLGAKEIGFTVVSMSASLVAVFIPILLMGGIVGRLFREFAVVLSTAIGISLVISLTTTPMLCAFLLRPRERQKHSRFYYASEKAFDWILSVYERTLTVVLRHPLVMLIVTLSTIVLTIALYVFIPKGFFPQQDTGRLSGSVLADQATSFQTMRDMITRLAAVVQKDPGVSDVIASAGGRGSTNTANMYISLKPLKERKVSADQIINRLRGKLSREPGVTLYLQVPQDLRIGGHSTNAQWQYTLQGDDLEQLLNWAPKVFDKLKTLKGLADVNSDQQVHGLEAMVTIDRDMASRLGITVQAIDRILSDAFGQSQVSIMYTQLNQYHVVMEVAPSYWQNPHGLDYIYLPGSGGKQIPLSQIARFSTATTSLTVNHQAQFPAVTISFNLLPGVSLGDAVKEINEAESQMEVPTSIHGSFQGTAQAFQASLSNELFLIIAAIVTVYIVLGMLYESMIHPITILSTIPSAGVGALLALLLFGADLDVMGMIGIILLIGIVKKNAIMMIDFALEAERRDGKSPRDAIFQACMLRFRPIVMTTMAALLGGLPLALGTGTGSELRRPLGIAIVGGLIFSQMLTLYTTPVIYLYLDRLRLWLNRTLHGREAGVAITPEMA